MDKNEYNRIRELILLYYRGETTREQERELERFFFSHDRDTLPDDLKTESDVFITMASLNEQAPLDLQAIIDDAVTTESKNITILPSRKTFYRYSAAAVFLIAIIAFSFLFFKKDISQTGGTNNLIVNNEEETVPPDSSALVINEVTVEEVAQSAEIEIKKPKTHRVVSLKAHKPTIDSYRIVDDEEEAINILLAVNARLESTLAKGADAEKYIPQLDVIINNVSNKLNIIPL
ncbi:MAG: hypothetical protein J1E38_02540 [Paramuribaculum sp.]|nr:hypothetical protein [Paramuribaculum sp.]